MCEKGQDYILERYPEIHYDGAQPLSPARLAESPVHHRLLIGACLTPRLTPTPTPRHAGHVVRDSVGMLINSTDTPQFTSPAIFGCQMSETGLFRAQMADGEPAGYPPDVHVPPPRALSLPTGAQTFFNVGASGARV